ncbi:MAG: CHAP domain-containing protein [Romboutsia sp.]|nr:CHAP domain-containing protein [Romboutsia sp.]
MAQRKNVENLEYSKIISLPLGTGYTPQSLAFKSKKERYVLCSGVHPNRVLKCNENHYENLGKKVNVGHANGATYCNKNGLIYATAYEGGNNKTKIRAIDPNKFVEKFTVTLPTAASGIAYDSYTNQFLISCGNNIRIFPYSAFEKGGTYSGKYKSIKKQFTNDGRFNQDIGAHNGIALVCRSYEKSVKGRIQTAYIDCYDIANGEYLKSYKTEKGEIESVAIDSDGHMHVLFAQWRNLVKTKNVFKLKGSSDRDTTDITNLADNLEGTRVNNSKVVIEKAQSFLGEGGSTFWSFGDLATGQPWCACFVWCIINMCNLPDCCYPKGTYRVDYCREWMEQAEGFNKIYSDTEKNTSLSIVQPADIFIYKKGLATDQHIGFVLEAKDDNSFYTIEGNWSGKVSSVVKTKAEIQCVFRPPYGYSASSLTLKVSPEKLYSSNNYSYIEAKEEKEDDRLNNLKSLLKNTISNKSEDGFKPALDTSNVNALLTDIHTSSDNSRLDKNRRTKTKIDKEAFGPALPIALNPVEAPFVELTIGGYTFGTFQSDRYDRYPNYINSMNVVRTNGSMNEYTINLIHQIRPGSNPNFIDELLSKNGYEKITIKYGDANSNIMFTDSNALLIGVSVSFDFVNSNASYTIKATSSSISIASHKRTFASITDKPSNVIRNLLYNDSNEDLLTAFPAMRDKNFVEKNNLIPNNDLSVPIEEFKNINAVSYLKSLVSVMKSNTNDIVNSTYMMTLEDGYFRINELSNTYVYDASLYEVDVNFPDANQVFSFSVDTNYSWPISYNYSGGVSNYNYDISNQGNIVTYNTNSSNLLDYSSPMLVNVNDNWWTQVNEFPIKAKLTCRGLLSPLLLLTYIKINCIYFGSSRITSGVYIVTGQEDSLSGSGYRTTLSLLRVAGSKQQIIVDGRVKT